MFSHGIISSSGVQGFLPTDLAGIKIWLKADAGVTLNGSTVSNWADQSGNGNHATQVTASNQPTLVSNVLNGKPVMRFDGTNDSFNLTANLNIALPGVTLFFVSKRAALANLMLLMGNTNAGNGYDNISQWSDNTFYFLFNYDSNSALATIAAAAVINHSIISITYNLVAVNLSINKIAIGSAAYANPTTFNRIGTRQYGDFMTGDIAEIIQYDTVLSGADKTKVENYLSTKYAL